MSETAEALVVFAGARRWAVPMERVAEVRLYASETPLPAVPKCVRGLVEHNGTPVHLIDAAQRFGRQRSTPGDRTCIVFFENVNGMGVAGMLVDDVEHIVPRNFVETGESIAPRDLVAAFIA